MSYATLLAVEEWVDHCGSLPAACEMLRERIARRKSEGKTSPQSEQQLAYMERLWEKTGGTYMTPKQERLQKRIQESGGHQD